MKTEITKCSNCFIDNPKISVQIKIVLLQSKKHIEQKETVASSVHFQSAMGYATEQASYVASHFSATTEAGEVFRALWIIINPYYCRALASSELHRHCVFSSWNRASSNAPDFLGILGNGTVAAEFATSSCVQYRHLDPSLLVPVSCHGNMS
jgi:hypothetical protein